MRLDELTDVDEVVVALCDLPGRLVGTALAPAFFVDDVVPGGYGACAYLLAADVEMETGEGYAFSPTADGFGDLRLVPDLATLRRAPWRPESAIVLADARWPGGDPVRVAPRQILRTQLERLAERGLHALTGTELEFLVFGESYDEAARTGYGGLTPATRYGVDYALTGTHGMDDLVRTLRNAMAGAGIAVESARAEVHPGQYEIVFRYADALATCDAHVLYKTTAKNLAAAAGRSITFMPKYDAGEGNSCHVHLSLRDGADRPVFADGGGMSALMRSFVAGQLACLRELTLLFAPSVNAYKRLVPDTFAPTVAAWGRDNRLCPVRVVGAGPSLRLEHRVAGGDANPYVATAAILAAGLHGIERGLELEPPMAGPPTCTDPARRLPRSLGGAAAAFRESAVARAAFGDDVVEHYAHAADAEVAAFAGAGTDWERHRAFERL